MRNRHDLRPSFRPLLEALEIRTLLAVCTVDRLTDVGEGQGMVGDLRYCIEQANSLSGDDIITVVVTGTINLAGGLPSLSSNIDLQGPGANLVTIRGNLARMASIFKVDSGANVTLAGLTITSGNAQDGGGIFNSGVLTLHHAMVSGNHANDSGGGIFNTPGALLTLNHTTVSGNRAESEGGGIYNRDGSLILSNSTVSGNAAMLEGGGIFNNNGASLTLDNSTISNNEAIQGGGLAIFGFFAARNTIIAGNSAIIGADLDGDLGSLGNNLIGNSNGGTGYAPSDLLNVNPLLGLLQDNGGPTLTHALLPGSPAIDAGDNTDAPEFDQRGLPRITGNRTDIGAFEVQPGPAASFYLYVPESVFTGAPFDLYLVAYDADGYVATTYMGTVVFSATDPDAVLPEPYTFSAADAGTRYLPESAVLFAEGVQEVGAYDVETFAVGVAYVEVFPVNAPGGAPYLPWAYQPDVTALLALMSQQPRLRP